MYIRPTNWTESIAQPADQTTTRLGQRLSFDGTLWRRCLLLTLVGATVFAGVGMMLDILRANGTTVIEILILGLFAITFTWITVAFWIATAGFICRLLGRDAVSLAPQSEHGETDPAAIYTRTALIIPIYNEDPDRVMSGIAAMYRSLSATGVLDAFDFYILSDTRDPKTAAREAEGWRQLCRSLNAEGRLFYRRRDDNTGRKAGNIADFCRRWGRYYEHMVALDADSIMTGDAIVALVRAMEERPEAGIIQTVPLPVRQDTLFGRFHQFAARIHSPVLATGLSFWQTGDCNYWGHNAIIRTAAFTANCGLPKLPGKPPLGGEILSHDFVEAAFLRRGNWRVYLLPEIKGSFEEMPGNILDYAKRDQRWAQGNLQHLKLLTTKGLRSVSRLHFLFGALAYGSSLIWLGLLGLTTIDALSRTFTRHKFFSESYQLFPNWPVIETETILFLLFLTVLMLGLPKLWGVILTLKDAEERQAFGGTARFALSAIAEIAFSVIVAPIMMCFHAFFVVTTLAGRVVSWAPQNRTASALSFRDAAARLAIPTFAGLAWGGLTFIWTPGLFWWLLPVTIGLTLSIPLAVISSRPDIGAWMRQQRLLVTPEEGRPPVELQLAPVQSGSSETAYGAEAADADPPPVPREIMTPMPVQPIERWAWLPRTAANTRKKLKPSFTQ